MEREIIKLTEYEIAPILYEFALEEGIYDEIFDDNGDIIGNHPFQNFTIIQDNVNDWDLEKGYEEHAVIVKRLFDNKYFKGYYMYSPYNGVEFYHYQLKEVFPQEETIIIYE